MDIPHRMTRGGVVYTLQSGSNGDCSCTRMEPVDFAASEWRFKCSQCGSVQWLVKHSPQTLRELAKVNR